MFAAFRRVIPVAGLCLLFGGSAPAYAASSNITATFEDGTLGPLAPSGNSPEVTTEQARAGHYATKEYLDRLGSNTSYRTEMATQDANAIYFSDTWYGLSVFLPTSHVVSPVWEIVFQWHGVTDETNPAALNPPMSMHTENGVWLLNTIGDSRIPADKSSYESLINYKLGSYSSDLGKWTDWVFHIRWDYRKVGAGNNGILQVWKNGVEVINVAPVQLGFNNVRGPYFKMGLYKGWRNLTTPVDTVTNRLVYHDEFRQAGADGSYSAVAPTGSKSPGLKPSPPNITGVH